MTCWQQMVFITDPACARCGFPFEYDMGHGALCAGCIHTEPSFTAARAVFRYDTISRAMILRYKYHDHTYCTPTFSRWLAKTGAHFIPHCDAIIPVPLHYRRLLHRRYNQAALLAHGLGRLSSLPVYPRALERTRHTRPQTGLTFKKRQQNVAKAFALSPKHAPDVKGKTLLLVDDVLTTGATLNRCTDVLLKAGAKDVYVLTLARTVHG
jgi:ComF family protein